MPPPSLLIVVRADRLTFDQTSTYSDHLIVSVTSLLFPWTSIVWSAFNRTCNQQRLITIGKNGSGIYIRAHRKSLNKAKEKLKLLTKRNRGRNVRRVMQEVKVYIRGWLGYFHVADMKRTMKSWDEWLRRRFRMYIWKQWKKPRTKVANLRKLGIPADKAYQWGNSRLGYWRIAGSPVLECSITNERLATAGYFGILNCYESLHSCD